MSYNLECKGQGGTNLQVKAELAGALQAHTHFCPAKIARLESPMDPNSYLSFLHSVITAEAIILIYIRSGKGVLISPATPQSISYQSFLVICNGPQGSFPPAHFNN